MLAGLFFAGVCTFAQLYSPQALLPDITATLAIAPSTAALVLSVSTVGLAVGVLPWSALSDRVGRVRVMTMGVASATIVGLVVPFAPSIPLLLAGRFLEGVLVAGVPSVVIAYLGEEIHLLDAGRAAGTYVAGTSIGGLLGRLVAGPIGEWAGWRIGMLSVAVVCAVASVVFIRLVPAPLGFAARVRGGVPGSRAADGVGAVAGAEEEAVGPGLAGRLWASIRSPRLLALYAQGFLLMGGFVALYNYLAFRLEAAPFWVPQAVISLIFLAYLAGTWSSAQVGTLIDRLGRRPALLVSAGVMTAGVLLTLSDALPVILLGLVVATAGFFAAHSVASGWTGREATVGRAQAASLYNLFYYAGSSLFGWLGGVLLTAAGWPGVVAMIVGLVAAAMLAAGLVLRPVLREP